MRRKVMTSVGVNWPCHEDATWCETRGTDCKAHHSLTSGKMMALHVKVSQSLRGAAGTLRKGMGTETPRSNDGILTELATYTWFGATVDISLVALGLFYYFQDSFHLRWKDLAPMPGVPRRLRTECGFKIVLASNRERWWDFLSSNNKLSFVKDLELLTSGKPMEIWISADENDGNFTRRSPKLRRSAPSWRWQVGGQAADCSIGWEDAKEFWVDD